MAGAAGTLLAMWYSFTPDAFGIYNIRAFAVVVLGGLGSIPGALIGGLVFGVLDQVISSGTLGGFQLGALKEALIFLALVAILVVRPDRAAGQGGLPLVNLLIMLAGLVLSLLVAQRRRPALSRVGLVGLAWRLGCSRRS